MADMYASQPPRTLLLEEILQDIEGCIYAHVCWYAAYIPLPQSNAWLDIYSL